MAATTAELERMIIRLIGDGTSYVNMLKGAQAATTEAVKSMGDRLKEIGGQMRSVGQSASLYITAPIVAIGGLSVKAFADYQQALADLTAVTSASAAELVKIEEVANSIAAQTGILPKDVISSFSELIKAGISLDKVLGGVGETAVKFARVSGMDMASSAIVLVDAMNVFAKENLTAAQAANIMSVAADASSISLKDVADGFGNAGATLALFGQNMQDTATALAILGAAGVKGADAGTVLKTMFLRIATGADSAQKVIEQYGLQFRDANGQVKPVLQVIEELERKLGGLNLEARDRALADLFGDRGIRGAAILLARGSQGWRDFAATMGNSLSVGEKFNVMTDTFWGNLARVRVQISQAAIEIGRILAPMLREVSDALQVGISWWQRLSPEIRRTVVVVALLAAGVGPLLVGLGLMTSLVGYALSSLAPLGTAIVFVGKTLMMLASPLRLIAMLAAVVFSPVGLAVAAVVSVIAILVESVGGIGPAWTMVKDAAIAAWNWITARIAEFIDWVRPVASAAAGFFTAAWEWIKSGLVFLGGVVGRVLKSIWDTFQQVWGFIGPYVVSILTYVRDVFATAFLVMEFWITHFGDLAIHTWTAIKYGFRVAIDFLRDVLVFFMATAAGIFSSIGAVAAAVWNNIIVGFKKAINAVLPTLLEPINKILRELNMYEIVVDLIGDTGEFQNVGNAAGQSYQQAFDAQVARMGGGDMTAQNRLRQELEQQQAALGRTWDQFLRERVGANTAPFVPEGGAAVGLFEGLFQQMAALPPAARQAGQGIGSEISAGVKDTLRLDFVALESAEALARVADYRERLAAMGSTGSVGGGVGGAGGGGGGGALPPMPEGGLDAERVDWVTVSTQAINILTAIRDSLDGAIVVPADL